MPAVTVNIAPDIINWIMNQVQDEKTNQTDISNLIKWKAGEKIPTFNQIESLSKAINVPLGYFFLQVPPVEELAILEYRTVDSIYLQNPSRNLIDTINDMENVQEWMRDYLIKEDFEVLDFVHSYDGDMNVLKIADEIRKTLSLKKNWYSESKEAWDSFKRLRAKLEQCGVLVMMSGIVGQNTHRKLNIEEFRAFTLIDEYAPLIFINADDSKNGKLFSLLHEAAHIWIGVNDFFNDRYNTAQNVNVTEKLCNAVAAELLVPNNIFRKEWISLGVIKEAKEKIDLLAKVFRCGVTVIARRALENEFIERKLYTKIAEEAVRFYNEIQAQKVSSGGDYYNTAATRIDNRFIVALDNSVREGKTLFTDAYRLTNMNRKTFTKLVNKVRGIEL